MRSVDCYRTVCYTVDVAKKYVYKPEIEVGKPGYRIDKYIWAPKPENRGISFTYVGVVARNVPDNDLGSYLQAVARVDEPVIS